jgi:hypothetical protein
MTKKMKHEKKRAAQRQNSRQDLLRGGQMMQFVRQPKRGQEIAAVLHGLDQELEDSYRLVRELPCGDPDEEEALQAVRDMENRRFALLSEMHGNKIQAYRQR